MGRAAECGGGLEKVPSPLLQLCGWSHKEASLGAKDAGIDASNLADYLRLAWTWPLLLFFKPRILLFLQLYLDAGLVSAEVGGGGGGGGAAAAGTAEA